MIALWDPERTSSAMERAYRFAGGPLHNVEKIISFSKRSTYVQRDCFVTSQ